MGTRSKGKNGKKTSKKAKRRAGAGKLQLQPALTALAEICSRQGQEPWNVQQIRRVAAGADIENPRSGRSKKSRHTQRRRVKEAQKALARFEAGADKAASTEAREALERALGSKLTYLGRAHLGGLGYFSFKDDDGCWQTRPFRVHEFAPTGRRGQPQVNTGNVRVLWHGTSADSMAGISLRGFRTGRTGMFGPAVYLGHKEKAQGFTNLGEGHIGVLIKCCASLGKVADAVRAETKYGTTFSDDRDTTHGIAGRTESWGGTLRYDEWAVYDPRRVAVISIYVIDGRVPRGPAVG